MFKNILCVSFIFSLLLSGCSSNPLTYRIDPELSSLKEFASQSSLVAITVIDKRKFTSNRIDENTTLIKGPENEADLLKTKLIDALKRYNYKIISNPLLADIALELSLEEFNVELTNGFFKSNFSVASTLKLVAKQQQNKFEKLYKKTRSQDVANPANSNDATGLVNQVLSEQISTILTDPGLLELTKNISKTMPFNG